MSKAVIYVRVSSPRQVENTSLDVQETACRDWCAQNGIEVAKVFREEGESAKTANRTQFQRMFAYLDEHQSAISHVVVDKFDRFSRSVDEGAEYRMRLRRFKIALCSVKEPTDETPAGKFVETLMGAVAEFDNDTRSQRALDGMKASVKAGRWTWLPPLGYLTGRKNEPSLVLDPARADLLAKFFELVASGKRKADAWKHVLAHGLRSVDGKVPSLWTASKWLKNPLYCGRIELPKWGVSVKGDFEPLVSEETYRRVQDQLSGKAVVPTPHRRANEKYPLRRLVLCPVCREPATASTSKGKYNRYSYYHCHRVAGHFRAPAHSVESAFLDLLDRLQPEPDRMRLIEAIFRRVWTDKQNTADAEARKIKAELKNRRDQKERSLNLMRAGVLTQEDFTGLYQQDNAAIGELESQLLLAQRKVIDADTAVSYLMHLFWNSRNLWENSDLDGKQRIARTIFPEGIFFTEAGFGTPVTHSVYTLLADSNVEEGGMVRPRRFELLA